MAADSSQLTLAERRQAVIPAGQVLAVQRHDTATAATVSFLLCAATHRSPRGVVKVRWLRERQRGGDDFEWEPPQPRLPEHADRAAVVRRESIVRLVVPLLDAAGSRLPEARVLPHAGPFKVAAAVTSSLRRAATAAGFRQRAAAATRARQPAPNISDAPAMPDAGAAREKDAERGGLSAKWTPAGRDEGVPAAVKRVREEEAAAAAAKRASPDRSASVPSSPATPPTPPRPAAAARDPRAARAALAALRAAAPDGNGDAAAVDKPLRELLATLECDDAATAELRERLEKQREEGARLGLALRCAAAGFGDSAQATLRAAAAVLRRLGGSCAAAPGLDGLRRHVSQLVRVAQQRDPDQTKFGTPLREMAAALGVPVP